MKNQEYLMHNLSNHLKKKKKKSKLLPLSCKALIQPIGKRGKELAIQARLVRLSMLLSILKTRSRGMNRSRTWSIFAVTSLSAKNGLRQRKCSTLYWKALLCPCSSQHSEMGHGWTWPRRMKSTIPTYVSNPVFIFSSTRTSNRKPEEPECMSCFHWS